MIKKISAISKKHPLLCLFGLGIVVNLYIQLISLRIDSIRDPLLRQFDQNIFICLLCAIVAVAAVVFIFVCKAPSPTFNPADLTKNERALRRLLFDVIVPLIMTLVIIGDLMIVLHLKW